MIVKLFEEIEIQKIRVIAQEKYILDLYNNLVKHWAWDGLQIKAVIVSKKPELPQYVLEQTSASPLYKPKESIIPKTLGYLEIMPAYLNSTDQYDVRLVCTWSPVRSFWEGMAHHLQPENLYSLPKHLVPEMPWYRPPQSLVFPEKPPSPWEQIEDRGPNRKILQLWWEGHTNTEIGRKVSLSPPRITNILSELRTKYGKEIVRTNVQRREASRNKKS